MVYVASLYKCRRTGENKLSLSQKNDQLQDYSSFSPMGGFKHSQLVSLSSGCRLYFACQECEDKLVCFKVHGANKPFASLTSKTVKIFPQGFFLLLFNPRQTHESTVIGRFKFERKI